MKCIYCGSELKEGSLFCSHCGKEVQIVPDYNIYDDDYLKALLTENGEEHVPLKNGNSLKQTTSGRTSSNGNSVKGPEDPKKKTEQKRKLKIIIASVIAVVAVLVIVLVLVGTSIRKSHDNSFDYQVEMAEKAYHSGNIDEAISYYEKALSLDKENIDVRLTLAEIYMEKKDYDSALVLYQEVIQKDNKNQTACENLIALYEEQKNTDAILALADAVDDSLKDLFSDYMVTPPEFSIAGGEYEARQSVELSTSGNYNIYYTTDGSDPIERGIIYSGPIELSENNKTYMIKAVCRNEKEVYSDVVTNEYTINIPAPDMPIVTPDGGDFGVETKVTVTVPDGCSAYYTWDGSTPNATSSRYTQPITVPEGNNVLSVIIIDNTTGLYSDTFRGNFIYYSEDYSADAADAVVEE